MAPDKKKKKRSRNNYSVEEKKTLKLLISEKKLIIESKKRGTLANRAKLKSWQVICDKLYRAHGVQRTPKQLRRYYVKMKKEWSLNTGGGELVNVTNQGKRKRSLEESIGISDSFDLDVISPVRSSTPVAEISDIEKSVHPSESSQEIQYSPELSDQPELKPNKKENHMQEEESRRDEAHQLLISSRKRSLEELIVISDSFDRDVISPVRSSTPVPEISDIGKSLLPSESSQEFQYSPELSYKQEPKPKLIASRNKKYPMQDEESRRDEAHQLLIASMLNDEKRKWKVHNLTVRKLNLEISYLEKKVAMN